MSPKITIPAKSTILLASGLPGAWRDTFVGSHPCLLEWASSLLSASEYHSVESLLLEAMAKTPKVKTSPLGTSLNWTSTSDDLKASP